jgi:hypothetical protein
MNSIMSSIHSKERLIELKDEINTIKMDRIFNRIVDEIASILGVEFMTDAQYAKFEINTRSIIREELER